MLLSISESHMQLVCKLKSELLSKEATKYGDSRDREELEPKFKCALHLKMKLIFYCVRDVTLS